MMAQSTRTCTHTLVSTDTRRRFPAAGTKREYDDDTYCWRRTPCACVCMFPHALASTSRGACPGGACNGHAMERMTSLDRNPRASWFPCTHDFLTLALVGDGVCMREHARRFGSVQRARAQEMSVFIPSAKVVALQPGQKMWNLKEEQLAAAARQRTVETTLEQLSEGAVKAKQSALARVASRFVLGESG